jgi:hypothetical protein
MSFIVACGGGSGLLSSDQASNLNSQLDTISSALTAGQCGAVSGAASSFGNAVDNLPASVSPTLTNNLKQGAVTVEQLATQDCHSQRTTSTATNTVTTSTTATHTTSTASTPTNTTPAPPPPTTPATTSSPTGTSSTGAGTGGAGLPGNTGGGSGGAGSGNGNGNTQ